MQKDIFQKQNEKKSSSPLAEKLRPESLGEFAGQEHLVGEGKIFRKFIEQDNVPSIILWGPPGVGKTTLARIVANETKSNFVQVSAVASGKGELKDVVFNAREVSQLFDGRKTILFIDEIHRFNKVQQDYLLPFVEDGTITLIGATTENPSFEVISALLSRCRVFTLEQHSAESLEKILNRTIKHLQKEKELKVKFEKGARDFLLAKSNGDPRVLINAVELAVGAGGEL
jgi:putative ATPase